MYTELSFSGLLELKCANISVPLSKVSVTLALAPPPPPEAIFISLNCEPFERSEEENPTEDVTDEEIVCPAFKDEVDPLFEGVAAEPPL